MGTVPPKLAADLRSVLNLGRAIETGTCLGTGTAILSDIFPHVTTIELSPDLYRRAQESLSGRRNVEMIQGDSSVELKRLASPETPTFFFLDAHWSAGPTAGQERECPLLDELAVIADGHPDDSILIDDARLFLAPPPPPHDPAMWPTLDMVTDRLLGARAERFVTVVDDQVIAVPPRARDVVEAWRRSVAVREAAKRWRLRARRPFGIARRAVRRLASTRR